MRKVTRNEVLEAIWASRKEAIYRLIDDEGWISCPYTYEQFRMDMLKADLISDRRTIQTKWDGLVSVKTIKASSKSYTEGILYFEPFVSRMDPLHRDLLMSTLRAKAQEAHTDTQTHRHTSIEVRA